jgi:hypothetical protein
MDGLGVQEFQPDLEVQYKALRCSLHDFNDEFSPFDRLETEWYQPYRVHLFRAIIPGRVSRLGYGGAGTG